MPALPIPVEFLTLILQFIILLLLHVNVHTVNYSIIGEQYILVNVGSITEYMHA